MKAQCTTAELVRERREIIRTLSLQGQTVAQILPKVMSFRPAKRGEDPSHSELCLRKIVEKDRRLMGLSTYIMVDRNVVRDRRIEMRSLLDKATNKSPIPFSVEEFAQKHNVTPQAITNDLARMGESKNPAWMAKRLNNASSRVIAGTSTREAAIQNRISIHALRRFLVQTCPEWRELRKVNEDGPVTWVWPKKTERFLQRMDHSAPGTRDALNRSAVDVAIHRQSVDTLRGILKRTPEVAEDIRRRVHEIRRIHPAVLDLLSEVGAPIDAAWITRFGQRQARKDRVLLRLSAGALIDAPPTRRVI
jgi:hypothetical protein